MQGDNVTMWTVLKQELGPKQERLSASGPRGITWSMHAWQVVDLWETIGSCVEEGSGAVHDHNDNDGSVTRQACLHRAAQLGVFHSAAYLSNISRVSFCSLMRNLSSLDKLHAWKIEHHFLLTRENRNNIPFVCEQQGENYFSFVCSKTTGWKQVTSSTPHESSGIMKQTRLEAGASW